jgi:hypothetical protein
VSFRHFFDLVMDSKNMRDDLERVRVLDAPVYWETYPESKVAVVTPQNAFESGHKFETFLVLKRETPSENVVQSYY